MDKIATGLVIVALVATWALPMETIRQAASTARRAQLRFETYKEAGVWLAEWLALRPGTARKLAARALAIRERPDHPGRRTGVRIRGASRHRSV